MDHRDFDSKLQSLLNGTVTYITVDSLYHAGAASNFQLLDIRSSREFNVSHIRGARCYEYESFRTADLGGLSREDTVVVYCSVGYRSEKAGEILLEKGFAHVYNLYGGIFMWKNDGHEVVDSHNEVTEKVHTYNRKWSVWLKNGVKVYD